MTTPFKPSALLIVASALVLAASVLGLVFMRCGSEVVPREATGVPPPPSMDDSKSLGTRTRAFHEAAREAPPPLARAERASPALIPPPAPPPPPMPPPPRAPSPGQLANVPQRSRAR